MIVELKHTTDARDGLLVCGEGAPGVQVVQGVGLAGVPVAACVVDAHNEGDLGAGVEVVQERGPDHGAEGEHAQGAAALTLDLGIREDHWRTFNCTRKGANCRKIFVET